MKNLFKIGILSLGLLACEKVVELDIPFDQSKLVINSIMNPDSSFSFHVSKSKYILDNASLQDIIDANLWVYQGEELIGKPVHSQHGYYVLEGVKPEIGKSYTLKAEKAGMGMVQAKELVLPPPLITGARLDTLGSDEYRVELGLEFEVQDPGSTKNYYMIRVYQETLGYRHRYNQQEPDTFTYWNQVMVHSPDPSLESACFSECGILFTDDFFNGKSYTVKLTAETYDYYYGGPPRENNEPEKEKEMYLVVYNISESAYLYLKTLGINSQTEGDPFSEPAKVFSNIEGGFGIFTSLTPVYVLLTP